MYQIGRPWLLSVRAALPPNRQLAQSKFGGLGDSGGSNNFLEFSNPSVAQAQGITATVNFQNPLGNLAGNGVPKCSYQRQVNRQGPLLQTEPQSAVGWLTSQRQRCGMALARSRSSWVGFSPMGSTTDRKHSPTSSWLMLCCLHIAYCIQSVYPLWLEARHVAGASPGVYQIDVAAQAVDLSVARMDLAANPYFPPTGACLEHCLYGSTFMCSGHVLGAGGCLLDLLEYAGRACLRK